MSNTSTFITFLVKDDSLLYDACFVVTQSIWNWNELILKFDDRIFQHLEKNFDQAEIDDIREFFRNEDESFEENMDDNDSMHQIPKKYLRVNSIAYETSLPFIDEDIDSSNDGS